MTQDPETELDASDSARSALWLRALARLPFSALYALTALIMWLLRHGLRFRVSEDGMSADVHSVSSVRTASVRQSD